MPDPSTELEELRRRVAEQSQRIDELQDALHTLSIAVQYRQEEPYLTLLVEHGIAGRPGRAELLEDFPALAEAYLPEPIDGDKAVRIVGEVLGSERLGAQALEAHHSRGLGSKGHQALTGRPDRTPSQHVAPLRLMVEPFDACTRASAIHPSHVDGPAVQGPHGDGPEGPDHPFRALTRRDAGPAGSRRQAGPDTTSRRGVQLNHRPLLLLPLSLDRKGLLVGVDSRESQGGLFTASVEGTVTCADAGVG